MKKKNQALLRSFQCCDSCSIQPSCFWNLWRLPRKCYFPKPSITPVLSQLLFRISSIPKSGTKNKRCFFSPPPYSKRCCILFLLLNPSDSCCGFLSKSVVSFFFFLLPSLSHTNKEWINRRKKVFSRKSHSCRNTSAQESQQNLGAKKG